MSVTVHPKRASLLEGFAGYMCNIVAKGATPEQWAKWLRVPLEHAAAEGSIDLLNALMAAGADGSAGWRGCGGRTLLQAGALGGNAEVVSALLRAGARPDVNVVSAPSSARSALYLATAGGHEDAARRLIMAGADVHFRDGEDECDVLFKAAEAGCTRLANELLIAGADPNTREGASGNGPLHVAAKRGCEEMASALLIRGADKDAFNGSGESPLIMASGGGHLAVVDTLLDAGADVEIREYVYSETALQMAAKGGNVEIINAILRHGADVNVSDGHGWTALHHAASADRAAAIDALVKVGANIEARLENNQTTPLVIAVLMNKCKAMRALLQQGANYDVGFDGMTLLHLACCSAFGLEGVASAVDLLLRFGGDETAVSDKGETPLQLLGSRFPGHRGFQDGVEQARRLLARAPKDRAWRRRCWLVMLRSRASKPSAASRGDNAGGGEHASGAASGPGGNLGSKAARIEHAGGGGSGVRGLAGGGCGAGAGEEVFEVLRAAVASLVGLELEGSFAQSLASCEEGRGP